MFQFRNSRLSARRLLAPLAAAVLFLLPTPASAQPDIWWSYDGRADFVRSGVFLQGWMGADDRQSFVGPSSFCMGPVTVSGDGPSLFVATDLGLARFDTNRRTLVELIPDLVSCTDRVIASPSGLRWIAVGMRTAAPTVRLRVVDAVSRTIVSDDLASTIFAVTFGPGGQRYELHRLTETPAQFEIRGFATETATVPIWQHPLDAEATASHLVASDAAAFVLITTVTATTEVVRLSGETGSETGRLRPLETFGEELLIQGLSLGDDRLYVAGRNVAKTTASWGSVALETLASPVRVTKAPVLHEFVADIVTSPGAAAVYKVLGRCGFSSPLSCAYSIDVADTVTLETTQTRGFTTSIQGGTFGQILEPGAPHITQLSTVGGRVALAWQLSAAGAPPRQFVIRGRLRGQSSAVTLATLDATERTWTSPVVPPGEYTVEVIGVNSVGEGGPARLDVGIQTIGTAEAPLNLEAFSAGRTTAHLTWSASPGGPVPTGYLVEAAPNGGAFAPVVTTNLPELAVADIPTGNWQVRIRALTADGAGPASNTVDVVSSTCVATVDAPSGLTASVDGTRVLLAWHAPVSGPPTSYRLVVSSDAAGSAVIATIPVSGTVTALDINAPAGIYVVRVVAESPCATDAASTPIAIRVP